MNPGEGFNEWRDINEQVAEANSAARAEFETGRDERDGPGRWVNGGWQNDEDYDPDWDER